MRGGTLFKLQKFSNSRVPQRDTDSMVGDILAFSRKTLVFQNYLISG